MERVPLLNEIDNLLQLQFCILTNVSGRTGRRRGTDDDSSLPAPSQIQQRKTTQKNRHIEKQTNTHRQKQRQCEKEEDTDKKMEYKHINK